MLLGPKVASSRCVIGACQLCVSAIPRRRFSVAAAGSRSLRSICRASASGLGITILERPVNASFSLIAPRPQPPPPPPLQLPVDRSELPEL